VHQIDVGEGAEQVETEPARAVDDRLAQPVVGRLIEWDRCGGMRAEIGDQGMEGEHHEDGEAAQVVQG
jgi:hypothetical protein